MASRSLGTLTLDLIAKVGGFTGPLDKASRESQKRMAEIKKSAEQVGVGIGVAVAAGVTALATLTVSSVKAGTEITRFAQISGASTTEFQKYAAGAKAVGIEQEKLSDIFKDTNDKVGDFLSTGGGELQNFFTSIAPKVGVTAAQFRNLSGPQALQLYVSSLEKAKVSQSEMTFYMEAIANDAALLTPLLRNSGEGFRVLGDSAEAAGAIMDDKTIKATQELSAAVLLVDQATGGLKNQITAEMLPVLSDLANVFFEVSVDGAAASGMASILSDTFRVTAQVAVGVVAGFDLIGTSLAGLGVKFANFKLPNWAKSLIDPMAGLQGVVDDLKADVGVSGDSAADQVNNELERKLFKYSEIIEALGKAGGSGETNTQVKELADLLVRLRAEGNKPGTFKALTKDQQDAAKSAETAAKKLQGIFDTTEQGYQREIELINTSNDARKNATEIAKLQFEIESGKLVGINGLQQKRLEGLAAELDSLKKLKQANEDAAKLADFSANVGESNQTAKDGFDQDLAGAGKGDKYRARLQEMLAIEQDFNRQQRELVLQRTSGDISQELYDQETEVLSEALAERLVLQQDYYNQLDEAQNVWLDGVSAAWENYRDTAMDYQQQAADFTTNTLQDATNSVGDNISDMALESESLGDAASDFATDMAESVVNALAQMAAQWLVYQAVQLIAGKTTQASAASAMAANASATSLQAGLAAFASTAAIPLVGPALAPAAMATALTITAPLASAVGMTAMAGMAHDGIDSVPETGTWLLQKGERVTTAETSAKLDRTLERVSKDGGGGGKGLNVQVANYGNDKVSTRMDGDQLKIIIAAAEDHIVAGIATGQGKVSRSMSGTYGLQRRGR